MFMFCLLQGISDIITVPGLINVDFADVRTIMANAGTAMLGMGSATGPDRAEAAALAAVSAPLIQQSVQSATGEQLRRHKGASQALIAEQDGMEGGSVEAGAQTVGFMFRGSLIAQSCQLLPR